MTQQDMCRHCGYIGKIGYCQGMHHPEGAQCLANQLAEATQDRDVWRDVAEHLWLLTRKAMPLVDYYVCAEKRLNKTRTERWM